MGKQQNIVINDDLTITINGYKQVAFRKIIYYFLCICSLGIFYLILHWYPKLKLRLLGKTVPIEEASELFIDNSWGSNVEHVKVQSTPFKGKISDIFTKLKYSKTDKRKSDEDIINIYFKESKTRSGVNNDPNIEQEFELKYFEYRYIRFLYNPITSQYEQIINWQDPEWSSVQSIINGIKTKDKYVQRQKIFGPNVSQIKQKSTFSFLFDEVLHPFYIFQVFSIILWCTEDYYYYAFCIFVMSVWSTLTTLRTSKKNLKKISEMSKFTCPVVVYRKDGQGELDPDYPYKQIDSSELVPGDIMVIQPNELKTLPCDAILLKGNCIVNESMLTGESMPVNKIPVKDDQLRSLDFEKDDIADLGNFCLFAGTTIIRVKGGLYSNNNGDNHSVSTLVASESDINLHSSDPNNNTDNDVYKKQRNIYKKYESKSAYALVVRTGFNTAKGSLVRSMLFPKENFFKFYRDSFKFIFILSIIALFGFCGTVYYFIKFGVPINIIVIRALDLITVVVPPALPATMSIGTSFAISKLKKKNIFCISPNHVIVGGKLNLLCFDKTGTLTENGLRVQGVHFIEQGKSSVKFSSLAYRQSKHQEFFNNSYSTEIISSPSQYNKDSKFFHKTYQEKADLISKRYIELLKFGMATCHNLKLVNDELIGDPLDIEMFKFIDWSLQETEGPIDGLSTIVKPKSITSNDDKNSKQFEELGILKVFEFISHLRRMSVVVRRMYSDGSDKYVSDEFEVFVKGAPETIRDLSKSETSK